MDNKMITKIIKVAHHRNGVNGEGFYAVLFRTSKDDLKVGIVFDTPGHVAILDAELLIGHIIEFGQNSWRGDEYETELRAAVMIFEQERSK